MTNMNDDQKQNFDDFNRRRADDLAKKRALNTDYAKNNGQPQNSNDYANSQKADRIGRQKLNTNHDNQREAGLTANKNQYAQAEKENPQFTPHQKAENLNTARRKDNTQKSEDKNPEKNKNSAPSKNPVGNLKNKLGQTKEALTGITKNPLWVLPFALAIACDVLDIPVIATWPIPFLIRPFVAIFLLFSSAPWGKKFKWMGILFADSVPVFGFIPGTTYCVYDAFIIAQEKK